MNEKGHKQKVGSAFKVWLLIVLVNQYGEPVLLQKPKI